MRRAEPNVFPTVLCAAIFVAGAAGVAAGAHLQRLGDRQQQPAQRQAAVSASSAMAQTRQSYQFAGNEPQLEPVRQSTIEGPKFSRIIIETSGVSRLEGLGTPGSQVLINTAGRMIAAAIVDPEGRWAVTLENQLEAGDHAITSVAAGAAATQLGDEVRVFIPPGFAGREVVAYDRKLLPQHPSESDAGAATSQRAQEIAAAATERFSELMPPARESTALPPVAGWYERAVPAATPVEVAQNASDPHVEASPPTAQGPITDFLSSSAAAVREWMKSSGETYDREIAIPLSIPSGTSPASTAQPAAQPPLSAWPVVKQSRPATDTSGKAAEAARKIALERERAEQRWRDAEQRAQSDQKNSAEIAKQAEDAKRRQAAEAAAAARDAGRSADDQARKAAQAKKIVEGLKRLEAAQRAEDERQAAAIRDAARAPKVAAAPQEEAGAGPKPAKRLEFTIEDGSRATADVREDDGDLRKDRDGSINNQRQAALDEERTAGADRGARVGGWQSGNDGEARRVRSCSAGSVHRHRGKKYYVVRPGDTLWAIANRHYKNGSRYNIIYRANTRRISDPDLIMPCQRLVLPRNARRIS